MVTRAKELLARIPRPVGVIVAVVVVLGAAVTWRWMMSPSVSSMASLREADADAVVMFVGGRGERLEEARALVDDGVADVLVIPNGRVPTWPEANALCDATGDVEVLCPAPDPDTTRGEAQMIAAIAEERDWTSLVAVTSTYHVSRAVLLLDRCYDGTITAVEASPDASVLSWVRHVAHEWAGHLHARLVDRGC